MASPMWGELWSRVTLASGEEVELVAYAGRSCLASAPVNLAGGGWVEFPGAAETVPGGSGRSAVLAAVA